MTLCAPMVLAAGDLSLATGDGSRRPQRCIAAGETSSPSRTYSLIVPAMPTGLPVKPRGNDPKQWPTTFMAVLAGYGGMARRQITL